jgi:hypothetical protein
MKMNMVPIILICTVHKLFNDDTKLLGKFYAFGYKSTVSNVGVIFDPHHDLIFCFKNLSY